MTSKGTFNNSSFSITAYVDLPILPSPDPKKKPKSKSKSKRKSKTSGAKKKAEKTPLELMEPRIINITY